MEFVVPVPVLLETFPAVSTPTKVKVYVLFGVTPFGVEVGVLVLLPQPGSNRSDPPRTSRASKPHAFLDRFPPATAPTPASDNRGRGNHRAKKPLVGTNEPAMIGP